MNLIRTWKQTDKALLSMMRREVCELRRGKKVKMNHGHN